jgi:hypothetical protein
MSTNKTDVTRILDAVRKGDVRATDELLAVGLRQNDPTLILCRGLLTLFELTYFLSDLS